MKLKKHFYTAIIPIALLTGAGTHIVAIILYALTHPHWEKFKGEMFFSKEIYNFILSDSNGKKILYGAIVLFVVLSTYLVRQSIFQKTYRDDSEFGVHGHATFQNPKELMNGKVLSKNAAYSKLPFIGYKKALNMEEGIILGKVGRKVLVLPDKTEIPNKNVLVIGPPGSGKGQTYVITNLVNIRNQSIINIDVKGENWHLTHQIKVDQGYKVGRLDFVDFKGWGFNPMAFVQNDEDAEKLANITARNALADGKEDFFQERARTLLKNMIVYVKTNFSHEEANFDTLLRVYDEHIASEKKFNEWIEEQDQEDIGVQGLKSFFASLTGKTRSSVTSSFDSIVSVYRLSKVRQMTKKSDFDFEDFVKDKYALYIKISVPSNPYKSLTSAFFTQMIDAFFTIARKSPISALPTPVNLLLDEFANIGKIDAYANTLSLCRGYLIYITTIIQDLSQLESVYGKDEFKTIIANHDTKLVLNVSEKETAKYFSEYFGETTVTYNEVTGTGSRAESKPTTVKKPLVTVNDLLKMKKNTAYVKFTGLDVCKIEKSWQFEIYGNMITKNRKYNYDKFRERIVDINKHPLYQENIDYQEHQSFLDIFNSKKEIVQEYLHNAEHQKEDQKNQEEIRQFLTSDHENQTENSEHIQNRIKTRLVIIDGIQNFILNNDQIQDKANVLSQLKERAEAIQNGESHQIKKLKTIKDRNLKEIARLEAQRIDSVNDAEIDELDRLLEDSIRNEISTQKVMIHMLETNENLINEVISDIRTEKEKTQIEIPSIEALVESHFAKQEDNSSSYDFADGESDEASNDEENNDLVGFSSISEDVEDPFKGF